MSSSKVKLYKIRRGESKYLNCVSYASYKKLERHKNRLQAEAERLENIYCLLGNHIRLVAKDNIIQTTETISKIAGIFIKQKNALQAISSMGMHTTMLASMNLNGTDFTTSNPQITCDTLDDAKRVAKEALEVEPWF